MVSSKQLAQSLFSTDREFFSQKVDCTKLIFNFFAHKYHISLSLSLSLSLYLSLSYFDPFASLIFKLKLCIALSHTYPSLFQAKPYLCIFAVLHIAMKTSFTYWTEYPINNLNLIVHTKEIWLNREILHSAGSSKKFNTTVLHQCYCTVTCN